MYINIYSSPATLLTASVQLLINKLNKKQTITCGRGQDNLLKFNLSITLRKNSDLCGFEHVWLFLPDGLI